MTTTPPEAPRGPDPREAPDDQGPRVSAAEARDLSRLRRSSTDRHVAGVAGGLGRHLDVDPVILRVAFVVLAFFGGAGLLLYAAGWLFVPRDDTGEATIALDARNRNVVLVLVGVVAALALLGDVAGGDWWFPWPLVLVGLFVAWLLSRRDARRGEPSPAAAEGTPVLPPPTRSPRRRGPLLLLFTLALVALAIGILGTVDLAGAPVAAAAYPALALALVGAVLVVGAFFGRAGGLVLVGLLLLPVLGMAAAADHYEGEDVLRVPTSAAALGEGYRLDAGEMVIDLTSVADLDRARRSHPDPRGRPRTRRGPGARGPGGARRRPCLRPRSHRPLRRRERRHRHRAATHQPRPGRRRAPPADRRRGRRRRDQDEDPVSEHETEQQTQQAEHDGGAAEPERTSGPRAATPSTWGSW